MQCKPIGICEIADLMTGDIIAWSHHQLATSSSPEHIANQLLQL